AVPSAADCGPLPAFAVRPECGGAVSAAASAGSSVEARAAAPPAIFRKLLLLDPLTSCIAISPAGRVQERDPRTARVPVSPHGTGCLLVPAMTPATPHSTGRFVSVWPLGGAIGDADSHRRPRHALSCAEKRHNLLDCKAGNLWRSRPSNAPPNKSCRPSRNIPCLRGALSRISF